MTDYKHDALIFKAFCDESRLRVIEQLRSGEKCSCKLLEEMPISQSTLSHHMKILVESGMVNHRKEGKWVYYSLSESKVAEAIDTLIRITKLDEEVSEPCQCNMSDE